MKNYLITILISIISEWKCFLLPENPASDCINVFAPEKAVIEILNMEGQTIKTIIVTNNFVSVDLSGLPDGDYLINASST